MILFTSNVKYMQERMLTIEVTHSPAITGATSNSF